MGKERRRATRYKVNRVAKVHADGSLPRDCLLVDISEAGVRLNTEAIDVPDEFVLMISGDEAQNRACQVVWRLGFEVGAKFTDQHYAFDWSVVGEVAA
jgi:hypothetical protein